MTSFIWFQLVPWIPYKAPVGVMDCYIAGMVADGFRSIVADVYVNYYVYCICIEACDGIYFLIFSMARRK